MDLNTNAFKNELESAINRYSIDNELNTPDFLLAEYIVQCLNNYKDVIVKNKAWHGETTNRYSGESDDVCRWYRFNNIRHKWYTDCRVDIEGHQEITAKICICGRKIKREGE